MFLKGKLIFVVEDNLQNRIVFQMSLLRHGAKTEFERWGRDAVSRLAHLSNVDLIILDLMLFNGISGLDLIGEIRALPRYISTPIVAVSAMDPSVAIPQVRARGFNGFIAKPIDDQLFPKQIAALLTGETLWHAGERA